MAEQQVSSSKARGEGAVAQNAEVLKTTTLSLPIELCEALRARAHSDRCTQIAVILDAIEAAQEELVEMVQKDQGTKTDGMFIRKHARKVADPVKIISIRILEENLRIIDALVASTGAVSRSRLVSLALRRYLTD
ncbi:ribbon-helix-helix protein, CopG family [Dermatophilus congolensis]|uniref:ribbon-helix-helix domain-containing protein n=1 Tax=Dermatophilus congolensis TaxID=1863 RepID=UPI001AAE7D61|nr:ribbon-helix-helix domain-containing protein [Dermatophilus congolensis]MBO3146335.1 ribbon-helix-helix protein, CopG family [Dermatophilus congolensis]MBO3148622.1 ribbon-helix-helix protein, CopG family [Dermatophilus congolensis]MBO3157571.1 ribbon-helix-helix protein, CopG family [Dermatophilus congolensis]MBO3159851.1 ribbon-helix-helix protein, CopG family [Dermatophilus congolensis]MBO3166590.1 ribbon-helix-helix protein, CopG family [Dermatophilus congolensis]